MVGDVVGSHDTETESERECSTVGVMEIFSEELTLTSLLGETVLEREFSFDNVDDGDMVTEISSEKLSVNDGVGIDVGVTDNSVDTDPVLDCSWDTEVEGVADGSLLGLSVFVDSEVKDFDIESDREFSTLAVNDSDFERSAVEVIDVDFVGVGGGVTVRDTVSERLSSSERDFDQVISHESEPAVADCDCVCDLAEDVEILLDSSFDKESDKDFSLESDPLLDSSFDKESDTDASREKDPNVLE